MSVFKNAEKFIYRNARPLDLARWKFHFENGSVDDVLHTLSYYQNDDGGFAYAIEPDNWNTASTPVGAWVASMILREVGFTDSSHPIIKGILSYLDSGKDFSDGKWFNTVKSNNQFPHAVWWECENNTGLPDDNPTVSLAGFALKFADKNSGLYLKAKEIVQKAVSEFIKNPTDEPHTIRCFSNLLCYCQETDSFDLFDLNAFKDSLIAAANKSVCKEPEKWYTDYVFKPSYYFSDKNIFNSISRELAEIEAEKIMNNQLPDGSYPVVWQWYNDYKEFEISANWWKSDMIIKNMLYLRYFGKIQTSNH